MISCISKTSEMWPSSPTNTEANASHSSECSIEQLQNILQSFLEAVQQRQDIPIKEQAIVVSNHIKAILNQGPSYFKNIFNKCPFYSSWGAYLTPLTNLSQILQEYNNCGPLPRQEKDAMHNKIYNSLVSVMQLVNGEHEKQSSWSSWVSNWLSNVTTQAANNVMKKASHTLIQQGTQLMQKATSAKQYEPDEATLQYLQQNLLYFYNKVPDCISIDHDLPALLQRFELAKPELCEGLTKCYIKNNMHRTFQRITQYLLEKTLQRSPQDVQIGLYQVALKNAEELSLQFLQTRNDMSQETVAVIWKAIIKCDEIYEIIKIINRLKHADSNPLSLSFLDDLNQLLHVWDYRSDLCQNIAKEQDLASNIQEWVKQIYAGLSHTPQNNTPDLVSYLNKANACSDSDNPHKDNQCYAALTHLYQALTTSSCVTYMMQQKDQKVDLIHHSIFQDRDRLQNLSRNASPPVSKKELTSTTTQLTTSASALVSLYLLNKMHGCLDSASMKQKSFMLSQRIAEAEDAQTQYTFFKEYIRNYIFSDSTIGYEKQYCLYFIILFAHFVIDHLCVKFMVTLTDHVVSLIVLSHHVPRQAERNLETIIEGINNAVVTYNQAFERIKGDPEGYSHGGMTLEKRMEQIILANPDLTGGKTAPEIWQNVVLKVLLEHPFCRHGIQQPIIWDKWLVAWQQKPEHYKIVNGLKYVFTTLLRVALAPMQIIAAILNRLTSIFMKGLIMILFKKYKDVFYDIYIDGLEDLVRGVSPSQILMDYAQSMSSAKNQKEVPALSASCGDIMKGHVEQLAYDFVKLLKNKASASSHAQDPLAGTPLESVRDSAIQKTIQDSIIEGVQSLSKEQTLTQLRHAFIQLNQTITSTYPVEHLYDQKEKEIIAHLFKVETSELTCHMFWLYAAHELRYINDLNEQTQTGDTAEALFQKNKSLIQKHWLYIEQFHQTKARRQEERCFQQISKHVEEQVKESCIQQCTPQEDKVHDACSWLIKQFIRSSPTLTGEYIAQMRVGLDEYSRSSSQNTQQQCLKNCILHHHTTIGHVQHLLENLQDLKSSDLHVTHTITKVHTQLASQLLEPLSEISHIFLTSSSPEEQLNKLDRALSSLQKNMLEMHLDLQKLQCMLQQHNNPDVATRVCRMGRQLLSETQHPSFVDTLSHTVYAQTSEKITFEACMLLKDKIFFSVIIMHILKAYLTLPTQTETRSRGEEIREALCKIPQQVV